MATSYLSRTFGTPTDAKKWTFSSWCKKGTNGTYHIFGGGATGQTGDGNSYLGMIPNFYAIYYDGTTHWNLYSSAVYRDLSGWYHYMFVYDSAQATASNRAKAYINGEQITSFDTEIYPSLNYSTMWNNSGITHYIARRGQSQGFEGSLAHVHFCDGYAYSPSDFGETDATTGIWKPKAETSVTYGNNGFFLKFENSNSMGTDSSGNANNFTVNGTPTQNIDTPSNVFSTWNPLQWTLDGPGNPPNTSFGNGNTSVLTSASSGDSSDVWGTLGASSGKYYHEVKMTNNPSDAGNTSMSVGWGNAETGERITYYGSNGYKYTSSGSSAYGATFTQNDIIGCAVDLTNGTIEFYKNGVSQGQITGEITTNTGFWQPLSWDGSGSLTASWDANFGNGYFGTTAVSSAQNPDDGIGIFEYDVPTGYRALCTKSINAEEYS
jgi:hypothetical protein